MKFFVRIEDATPDNPRTKSCQIGARVITGCTISRAYANANYGLGGYFAVYTDSSHGVAAAARKAGLTS
jgi:hypothetical protein